MRFGWTFGGGRTLAAPAYAVESESRSRTLTSHAGSHYDHCEILQSTALPHATQIQCQPDIRACCVSPAVHLEQPRSVRLRAHLACRHGSSLSVDVQVANLTPALPKVSNLLDCSCSRPALSTTAENVNWRTVRGVCENDVRCDFSGSVVTLSPSPVVDLFAVRMRPKPLQSPSESMSRSDRC